MKHCAASTERVASGAPSSIAANGREMRKSRACDAACVWGWAPRACGASATPDHLLLRKSDRRRKIDGGVP
jgi:hypothetical protein